MGAEGVKNALPPLIRRILADTALVSEALGAVTGAAVLPYCPVQGDRSGMYEMRASCRLAPTAGSLKETIAFSSHLSVYRDTF